MQGHIRRLLAVACLLIASAGAAQADVCIEIDEARDSLAPQDRAGALLLVTRQFEQAGEQVVAAGCPDQYSVSHATLGDIIVVIIAGPRGRREAIASGIDDLPAIYSQMVRSLVTGRPMTGFNVVDRTNVTESQTSARRVHSDSIWYARLGYGAIFGDRAYGTPAFGFGYRAELDPLALDIAFLNYQFRSSTGYFGSHDTAYADSLLKLSALYFLDPTANRTSYFGGGLSYGRKRYGSWGYGTIDHHTTDWEGDGLQGELTYGYEIARATSLRMFLQADAVFPFYTVVSQTFTRSGLAISENRRYAPSLVISVGIGR
jgi:hypothetical protein